MSMKENTGQKGQQLGQAKVTALLVSECRVLTPTATTRTPQFLLYFRNGQAKERRKTQIKMAIKMGGGGGTHL